MNMFPNQSSYGVTFKHYTLPVYKVSEFDFYRLVPFDSNFLGKTVSELHAGNLRPGNSENRYSLLFGDNKVSYWSDSINTALHEVLKHNQNSRQFLLFCAYDDASSTFPVIRPRERLVVADGRDSSFADILEIHDRRGHLSSADVEFMQAVAGENLDALAYCSKAGGSVNYLFTENGFNKLMLRSVNIGYMRKNITSFRLYVRSLILLVSNSDYDPILKNYGQFYENLPPNTIVGMDSKYLTTSEYASRKRNMQNSIKNFGRPFDQWSE